MLAKNAAFEAILVYQAEGWEKCASRTLTQQRELQSPKEQEARPFIQLF